MGVPSIDGDITGAVTEDSGIIITGDLDDVGFLAGNTDDTFSITSGASYGTATIDPTTGTWTYDLDDANSIVNDLGFGDSLEDMFTVFMLDSNGQSDSQVVTITISGVPCFSAGTMIETNRGQVLVENLSAGDMVRTMDAGFQPIQWVGTKHLDNAGLSKKPKLRPVRIKDGALGNGLPRVELRVSPQHRVLIDSPIAKDLFGETQVLVPAFKLAGLPGISICDFQDHVTYCHILLKDHHVIFSNGAPTESMFIGNEAIKGLARDARAELLELFPEIVNGTATPEPARLFVKQNKQVQTLKNTLQEHDEMPLCETG
ncbi:Hemolysin-type calcium-binding protein [Rhodobacteraceae bacterium HTCC2150]|nr:Hemolysin-type calcium-binding protein [Rhodobacteraceae bacterium HTCC2150]